MLIVICGADGAGKATQTKMLGERIMRAAGREVVLFSFPQYGTPIGKAILAHLKNEISVVRWPNAGSYNDRAPEDALIFQCLNTADKYMAAGNIDAVLRRGGIVICDRWWQSAYAYGAADGLDRRWLEDLHKHLPASDLNIYIDLPLEESLKRRPVLRDRYEKDAVKQQTVREIYRQLWDTTSSSWPTIDGTGTPEEVHERIWQRVIAVGPL